MKDTRLGHIQLIVGASLISFSPVFVAQADIGPTMSGFYRNLFGGIFMSLVVLARREPLRGGRRAFLIALAAAGLFALDLSLWHRSVLYLGPGLATLLANFQVFFLTGFGILVFRETVGWRFLVAIPLAVAGLFLLVGVDWNALEPGYRRASISDWRPLSHMRSSCWSCASRSQAPCECRRRRTSLLFPS